MSRMWLAGAAIAFLVALALKRFVRQKRNSTVDAGRVSEGWLAEQQGREDS